ncbi:MAG: hypothetical protein LBE09_08330 [Christensenellaceae bacterium]|jgi:hypothetical protein|nr:hypothetical protein [Christensenellaceae bacterium]
MKNFLKYTFIALLLISLSLSLFACANTPEATEGEKTFDVIFLDAESNLVVKIGFDKTSESYLEYALYSVANEEGSKITFDASVGGQYGSYLHSFTYDTVTYGTGTSQYIAIYIASTDATLIMPESESFRYQDKDYYMTAYGISKMPLIDGINYLLMVSSY